MEQNNREILDPVLSVPDENAEENTFFDHAYRQTQKQYESCATGQYTLDEIMASEGSDTISLLYGGEAGDLKTTTQMRVDEVIWALEHPEPAEETEEEDLTFAQMVARNEKILLEQQQTQKEPSEPYMTSVINARPGTHTQEIPVICVPNEAIYTEESAFIPVEAVLDEE